MQSVEVKDLQPGDVINIQWSSGQRATRTVESVYWHEERKTWAVNYRNTHGTTGHVAHGGWGTADVIVSVSRDVPVVQSARPLREPRPGVWEKFSDPDLNHPDGSLKVVARTPNCQWSSMLFAEIKNPETEYMVVPE